MNARPAPRARFQTQLLLLLLLFGVVPVTIVAALGYSVSRNAIVSQSETALRELANRQAAYLQTEIRREQLILRTIAGQIVPVMSREGNVDLGLFLSAGLADDGVFDGLRVLDQHGENLVDVALRETDPHWPEGEVRRLAPGLTLHLDGDSVIAYLLTIQLEINQERRWLQGHVRSADFPRNFDIPLHLLGGVELAVFDQSGHAIIVSHAHAAHELRVLFETTSSHLDDVVRTELEHEAALGFATVLPELRWTMVTVLPLAIVLAPVNKLLIFAIIGGTALVVLIVLAGHLASRYVTTPLRLLSDATVTFADTGSYDDIVHRGVAEIQTLIESFRSMADNLRRAQNEVTQLHDRDMERAQQLATVGELASGVAHEIRNPLTGVIGALEGVRRKIRHNDETLPLLDEARAQLARIETTTSQLLEYARPPTLRLIEVDLVGVVERAMRVVQPNAEKANVQCRLAPVSGAPRVKADPELVVQVMVNLLLNGIEASNGCGLDIKVVERGDAVEVRVEDHGAGVPVEKRQDIFRPFFTTKHQGTGLGLSISQQIVRRHGGTIRVEDTPGGGATFVMQLTTSGGGT